MRIGFSKILFLKKQLSLGVTAMAICFCSYCQCTSSVDVWNKLTAIGASHNQDIKKLRETYLLQKQFDKCGFTKDSVYARILDRIGLYEYLANNDLGTAIRFGLMSVEVATHAKSKSMFVAAKGYSNLGAYFNDAMLYSNALDYFDTAITFSKKCGDGVDILLASRHAKCLLYFKKGDYQKCIEESTIGLLDSKRSGRQDMALAFYNQRAQSYNFQSLLRAALLDTDSAIVTAKHLNDTFQFAAALKMKAQILAKYRQFTLIQNLFDQAIAERVKSGEYWQVADDYIDYGNFFLNDLNKLREAKDCYFNAIKYAQKATDPARLATAYENIGQVCFRQNNFKDAQQYYLLAMKELKLSNTDNFLLNSTAKQLNLLPNKDLLLVMLGNKTELLLHLFNKSGDRKNLEAALQNAVITDSVITFCRHEQLGEQSKLYWRNKTREFYTNALEACFLAGNQEHAFFFMEKSRAVLLNDQLNELGAASHLPPEEAAGEQGLKVAITQHQQRLSLYVNPSPEYSTEELKLLTAKENFEQYIKSLEQKYPAYYQYKYADEVPSLQKLQRYLSMNRQSFVHYFVNDTVLYIMSITGGGSKLYKLHNKNFNTDTLGAFLKLCSNRELLNANYKTYVSLSATIQNKLFAPLQLPKGRVIICPDNYLLPFEALATDAKGLHYLVEDYAFSYIYSARYLLAPALKNKSEGDYLGIAPISFAAILHVPDLKGSGAAIENAAKNFKNFKLIKGENASRAEFLRSIGKYDVVNIFSHARADSMIKEPAIFMGDSVIYLSELQLVRAIAAKIVVLSACQTSAGKNATGEGIYSLARGLAVAGIPAVAATIWDADEQSIYQLSAKFDENIVNGMPKDIALQKAKIWFIKQFGREKSLPYYWSNMILIGNTEPVLFSGHTSSKWMFWLGSIILTGILLFVFFKARKNSSAGLDKGIDHQSLR